MRDASLTGLLIMIGMPMLSAQIQPNNQPSFKIENINDDSATEFSPTISADGRTLIFQSDRNDAKWELFQSTREKNGKWSEPQPISAINDVCDFIAGPSLSYDGNTLYYTAFVEGVTRSEDIFYSVRIFDGWSPPVRMDAPVNSSKSYEGFPSVSSDDRQLFFIGVNKHYRKDGVSKEDCFVIYRSIKGEDGKWSKPESLPENINTGCVRDPRIMADNRTLLFSALEIDVTTQFDLFQTQLQYNGTWSPPVSLDYVNNDENNLSPAIPASGDTMYYYSKGDLYTTFIPPEYRQFFNATIQGTVSDFRTNKPLDATVVVRDAEDLTILNTLRPNRDDGRYSIILNAGRNYKVEYKIDGYIPVLRDFNLYYLKGSYEENGDVLLRSEAEVGFIVYDLDLDKAIPADIVIYQDNQMLQSFHIDGYDGDSSWMELDKTQDYIAVVSAPGYSPDSVTLSSRLTRSTMTSGPPAYAFYLEPEKASYNFNVRDVRTRKKIRTKLTIRNQDEDEIITGYSDETFRLRIGDQYEVLASGDRGYLFASNTIVASPDQADGLDHKVDVEVTPAQLNASVVLNNITFASNSAELEPRSMLQLERLVEFLQINRDIDIEVSAHSDDVGAAAYNLELSEQRAASVKDFLVRQGIGSGRIRSVGFGESKPLVPNTSEENRQQNRRVELRITGLNQ